jgi:hypothetical protein
MERVKGIEPSSPFRWFLRLAFLNLCRFTVSETVSEIDKTVRENSGWLNRIVLEHPMKLTILASLKRSFSGQSSPLAPLSTGRDPKTGSGA